MHDEMGGANVVFQSISLKLVSGHCVKVFQLTVTYSLISSMNEYVVNMITERQIRRLSANPKNLARDSTVPSPFTTRALPEGPHRTPLPSEDDPSTTSELDSTRKPKPESDPVPPPDLITVDNYCFPVLETINQPSSIAARLGHFKRKWMTLTQDPWIQQTVLGYKIPFTSPPRQWRPRITRATQLEMKQNLLTAINSLVSKGAVKEVAPPSRRIPVHTFSSRKTGQKWRISTSNKPESSPSVPSERDIQNGGSQHSSVTPTSGRFHDENGLKRRILCGTNLSSSQKVSEAPVREGDLRVPVPSLWPGISSKGIYQTPETYCCSDSVQGHTDSYISGRSPHYASGQSAMSEDIQPSHQSVIQSGIPDQTREMLELPNPTNNISRCTFEHHFNDHCLTRGEDGIDCTEQSSDSFNPPMLIKRALYAPRTHEPCGSNRFLDSPAPLPHASEDTHRRNSALGFQVEEAHSSATGFCLERPGMVDSTRTCSVQSTSNSITSLRLSIRTDASLTGWGQGCQIAAFLRPNRH